jgi:hypothetical protein
MIQNRLDKLKPYFKGLKVAESYRIVEFNLKRGWEIPDNEEIKYQQKEVKDNGSFLYNMFYSETKTFDEILSFIEVEVINHNLEIEEKERLLRAKVEELKRVFEDKTLDELNGLKFTTEDNTLKLRGSKNKPEFLKDIDNTKQKVKENGTTKELSTDSKSK